MSPLRVATVPDTHPYLHAVLPDSVHHRRLTGPRATGWELSPLFDASAFAAAAPELDLVHVHFGYEGVSVARLERFVDDVREAGLALVVTVHDLRNPHDRDPAAQLERLRILVTSADAVITLTPGAAAEIARRWSRPAEVVAHPSLLGDADRPVSTAPSTRPPVVGIHLKGLRTNVVDPIPLVLAAAAGAAGVGAVLRVDVHDREIDPDVLAALRAHAAGGAFDVIGHDRFTDRELIAYLGGLDVSVLPYRFGTHSGWLELCRDLGVGVVAPDCGFYAQQWDAVTTYVNNEAAGLDADSLRRAVRRAVRDGAPAPADPARRRAERQRIRAAHARIFAHAVAAVDVRRDVAPARG